MTPPRPFDPAVVTLRLQEITRLARQLATLGSPDGQRLCDEPTASAQAVATWVAEREDG